MTDDKITALAREYAEQSNNPRHVTHVAALEAEDVIEWLCDRYCLVEKSKVTDLCRLTLEHDQSVDYGLIDGLTDIVLEVFPEQYRQVAEELSNPEIAKEVES